MSAEEHKAIIRRWIEVWHSRDVDAVKEYLTPEYVRHDPNVPEVRGPDAEQHLMTMYLTALPDLHFTIEDLIAEGDTVVARLTAHGTQHGELFGIPPTHRPVAVTAVDIFRLVDGKIAEQWVTMDALGLMQQLGVIPAPAQT